jgi:hypothetical protein
MYKGKANVVSVWRRIGSGGITPQFLTLTLDGGEWSASRPFRLTPGERASGTHWIEGRVGLRAGLDAVEERKISCPSWNRTPAVQPIAHHYTDKAILAHILNPSSLSVSYNNPVCQYVSLKTYSLYCWKAAYNCNCREMAWQFSFAGCIRPAWPPSAVGYELDSHNLYSYSHFSGHVIKINAKWCN